MACGVPTACLAHHRRSTDDGLYRIDDTCWLVTSGDPHVPPSQRWDHGDASGYCHDYCSSHWWHPDLWAGVSRSVEGSSGLLSTFYPPMLPQIRRTRSHRMSTLGGSQPTSRPVQRMLTTESFRGTLGLGFDIWLSGSSFQMGVRTLDIGWCSRFSAWSGTW
jgi:hypothetical protein